MTLDTKRGHTMGSKPGLVTIAAAGLIVGLAACGSSDTTASSPAATTPSAGSSPTTSSAPQPAKSMPATSMPTKSMPAKAAPGKTASVKAAPVVITIKDFKYMVSGPAAHGEKIMIKNMDSESHTVTSEKAGTFNVTVGGGGGTATLTAPSQPGSYMFTCTFHANMMGALVVS